MQRRIVLCADDYAMNAGVSRGIATLAGAGRISATSAMANAPDFARLARDLVPLAGRIGIGLHLTLTWGGPLGAMPGFAPGGRFPALASVVRRAMLRGLPGPEIKAEIARQLSAFRDAFGREPDFVDGHQHVHALPGVRDALLRVLSKDGLAGRVWLRDPADSPVAIVRRRLSAGKALVMCALSAGFGAQARAAGFQTNRGFSGFSPFDPARDPAGDFPTYFVAPGQAHLVMCHPGEVGEAAGLDEVVESRRRELDYLASPDFGQFLAEQNIELVPAPV